MQVNTIPQKHFKSYAIPDFAYINHFENKKAAKISGKNFYRLRYAKLDIIF